jgi:hypothetical protein
MSGLPLCSAPGHAGLSPCPASRYVRLPARPAFPAVPLSCHARPPGTRPGVPRGRPPPPANGFHRLPAQFPAANPSTAYSHIPTSDLNSKGPPPPTAEPPSPRETLPPLTTTTKSQPEVPSNAPNQSPFTPTTTLPFDPHHSAPKTSPATKFTPKSAPKSHSCTPGVPRCPIYPRSPTKPHHERRSPPKFTPPIRAKVPFVHPRVPEFHLPQAPDKSPPMDATHHQVHPPNPHERSFRIPGGPPVSTLPATTDSAHPSTGNREKLHPPNSSESPIDAPRGSPRFPVYPRAPTIPASYPQPTRLSTDRVFVAPVLDAESYCGSRRPSRSRFGVPQPDPAEPQCRAHHGVPERPQVVQDPQLYPAFLVEPEQVADFFRRPERGHGFR